MSELPGFSSLLSQLSCCSDIRDCHSIYQAEDSDGQEYQNNDLQIQKLNEIRFYSPLDIIIPPSKMLEDNSYEKILLSASGGTTSSQLEDIYSSNNRFIESSSDFTSLTASQDFSKFELPYPSVKSKDQSKFEKKIHIKKVKNQYDKNIVNYVSSTIIRRMISSHSLKEVNFYCLHYKVNPKDFINYFKQFLRKNNRIGTTELYYFFRKNENNGFKHVFALFMTRFINEDYLSYILSAGMMKDAYKYLEYATNLLYVPRIQKQQYDLISRFHQSVTRDV